MAIRNRDDLGLSEDLLEAIRSFPAAREVEHCGQTILVSPFDFYANCPYCGSRLKLRSYSGVTELEDVFDAVFEWLGDPQARQFAGERQRALESERDENEED